MPKQAIALLIHKDIVQVNSLVELLEPDFDLYVHIDKKCDITPESVNCSNVWKTFKVNWGGYEMVRATDFLYRKILESGVPYTHVILLSGDSMPVKSNQYIVSFLNRFQGVSFLENKPAEGTYLERRSLFWNNENLRKRVRGLRKLMSPFRVLRWLQKRLNLRRNTKGFESRGSQWTILALPHVRHLLENCRLSDYRYMAVPDESFVQNHFTNHRIPFSDNLVYAHWPKKRSLSPLYIDNETFLSLIGSPFLFARKFEPPVDTRYDTLFFHAMLKKYQSTPVPHPKKFDLERQ